MLGGILEHDTKRVDFRPWTTPLKNSCVCYCDCCVSMSTMSQRSHLTDSEAWRVVGRLEGSQTQAEVAQAIGVSQSVISRIWNRFLETGCAGRR
ncbi:hypothetical protein TNCV_4485011 [Trichonephila clavipes]|nr:hypothetical protein TNCV_4485011 [Trichonephila clavipes]